MAYIGHRFTLTVGSFEDHVANALGNSKIDIVLVDAIHTNGYLNAQYEILLPRMRTRGIILFDDIDLPCGNMAGEWKRIWQRPEVLAACEVDGHTGIIEVSRA